MSVCFDDMLYGPLGRAVDRAMPYTEADPVGVYAAVLSLWSAAINGQILQPSGRPSVFWSALIGRSKFGRKGFAYATARAILDPSIGKFLNNKCRKGISSGPALVTTLFEAQNVTKDSEGGVDKRIMIMEDEWASVLKRANKDSTYHDQLINAWDGSSVVNTTKGKDGRREEQRIDDPLLGFHAHIQPGRWVALAKPEVVLSGAYNRIPHFLVQKSKNLPSRMGQPLDAVQEMPELTAAYWWTREQSRVMEMSHDAALLHDEYRMEFDDRCAELPENVACFIERGDENLLRVACVLAAAEQTTVVSAQAWLAARALIEYSIQCTERLLSESKPTLMRQVKSVEQTIRETLERFGGEATRTLLLRALGSRGNAQSLNEALDSMPDVTVRCQRPQGHAGAPTYIISLNRPADIPQEPELEKPKIYALPDPATAEPDAQAVKL